MLKKLVIFTFGTGLYVWAQALYDGRGTGKVFLSSSESTEFDQGILARSEIQEPMAIFAEVFDLRPGEDDLSIPDLLDAHEDEFQRFREDNPHLEPILDKLPGLS